MILTASRNLILLTGLLLACLVGCQGAEPELTPTPAVIIIDPPLPAADFKLTNHNNQTIQMSDFRGNLVLVYFGFIFCPEECPTTLGIWKRVHAGLGENAKQVDFMMISVDPERDTPEKLGEYLAVFHDEFFGLTGTLEQIEDVASDFSISFHKVALDGSPDVEVGDDYLIEHAAITYLIDQTGKIVLAFPYNTGVDEIISTLNGLLE